jgi:hypothetical protein
MLLKLEPKVFLLHLLHSISTQTTVRPVAVVAAAAVVVMIAVSTTSPTTTTQLSMHPLAQTISQEELVAPTHNFPYEMKAPDYEKLASTVGNGFLMYLTQQLSNTPLVNATNAPPTNQTNGHFGKKRGLNKKKLSKQNKKRFNKERGSTYPVTQLQFSLRRQRSSGLAQALDVEAEKEPTPEELQEAICFYTHLPMHVPPGLPDISQTAGIEPSFEKSKFNMLFMAPDRDNGVINARDVRIGIKVNTHATQYIVL